MDCQLVKQLSAIFVVVDLQSNGYQESSNK